MPIFLCKTTEKLIFLLRNGGLDFQGVNIYNLKNKNVLFCEKGFIFHLRTFFHTDLLSLTYTKPAHEKQSLL